MYKIIYCILFIFLSISLKSQSDSLVIATWNLEHLGSDGRGFPEHVSENFKLRTSSDLRKIAVLIRDDLKLDIVCLQEIAITRKQFGKAFSDQLDVLLDKLGQNWAYYLTYTGPCDSNEDEMQNAFLYNTDHVQLLTAIEMDVPRFTVGEKQLFDRIPLVGHFTSVQNSTENQFVLVNVHLASGQDNDENHLAAMVILEQNLRDLLKSKNILEPNRTARYALEDVAILGDFNDNPYALKTNGDCCKYLGLLYEYMAEKNYQELVTKEIPTTRMSNDFNSTIDHVLVHRSLKKYINVNTAYVYYPFEATQKDDLKKWRKSYSDHFPVYFKLGIR